MLMLLLTKHVSRLKKSKVPLNNKDEEMSGKMFILMALHLFPECTLLEYANPELVPTIIPSPLDLGSGIHPSGVT